MLGCSNAVEIMELLLRVASCCKHAVQRAAERCFLARSVSPSPPATPAVAVLLFCWMNVQMRSAVCVCIGEDVRGLLNSWIGGWLRGDPDIYFALMARMWKAAGSGTRAAVAACCLREAHCVCFALLQWLRSPLLYQ